MSESFPFVAALFASILHVIKEPAHLAAVIPFAIESKKRAWKVGLFWSFGHSVGIFMTKGVFNLISE